MRNSFRYHAPIKEAEGKGGAYIRFPYDIKKEFGKGRVKVHAKFDGHYYRGSLVNMGVKNPDGSICYIIGISKEIRQTIGKDIGDLVKIEITEYLEGEKEEFPRI